MFIFSSSFSFAWFIILFFFSFFFLLNWKTCFCGTFKSTLLFFFLFTTCGDRCTRTRRDVLIWYSLFIFQYSERNWFENFQMLANYCYFGCAEFQSIYIAALYMSCPIRCECESVHIADQHQYIAVLTVRGRPNPRTQAHTVLSLSARSRFARHIARYLFVYRLNALCK